MPYKDPEKQREFQQRWYAARRAEFFAGKSCKKCGSTEQLRLDHIEPKSKTNHRVWSWSQIRRNIELAKCQILCEPCHKEKTYLNHEKARGEAVGVSKLTEVNVREIRSRWENSYCTKRGLAREYGVDEKVIRLLLKGEIWKHVQ